MYLVTQRNKYQVNKLLVLVTIVSCYLIISILVN